MTTSELAMASYPIWDQFGISKDAWYSLARMSNRLDEHGVKTTQLMALKGKDGKVAGIELLIEGSRGRAFLLSVNGRSGECWLEIGKMDCAPGSVVKGDVTNLDTLAGRIIWAK